MASSLATILMLISGKWNVESTEIVKANLRTLSRATLNEIKFILSDSIATITEGTVYNWRVKEVARMIVTEMIERKVADGI